MNLRPQEVLSHGRTNLRNQREPRRRIEDILSNHTWERRHSIGVVRGKSIPHDHLPNTDRDLLFSTGEVRNDPAAYDKSYAVDPPVPFLLFTVHTQVVEFYYYLDYQFLMIQYQKGCSY